MTDYPPGPIGAALRAANARDQRHAAGRLLLDQHSDASLAKLYDRAEQAETALARVRELHANRDGFCADCSAPDGENNCRDWPCDTIRALDEPKEPGP